LNNEEESKDVVQESFISVWKNMEHFNPDKDFKYWLNRIVVNKCYDVLRKIKREDLFYADKTEWDIPDLFSDSNSDTKLNNMEIAKVIRLFTRHLSPKQKLIFILSELQGLTHSEISDLTGIGKNAIKSNLNFARRNIGKMLEKYI
jgi:RNA polymerase sigma-70 factor (ECF subfamily)